MSDDNKIIPDDFAKIEPGKREVTRTTVGISEFLNDPAAVFAKAAKADVIVVDETTGFRAYLIRALGLQPDHE